MTNEIIVAPSILSGDFANMGKSVQSVKEWGGDWVHCDVMDGVYVTNLTFGMPMISALRKVTDLPLDVHLMITKPERYVERFVSAGGNYVTFHPEVSDCPLETIKLIKKAGGKAGIALNPDVSVEDYFELLPECDIVVIMTVYAGYGGQKLIEDCLNKVSLIKNKLLEIGSRAIIEVDGGVTEDNAGKVIRAGADVLVAGSAVFKSVDPKKTIEKIKGVS